MFNLTHWAFKFSSVLLFLSPANNIHTLDSIGHQKVESPSWESAHCLYDMQQVEDFGCSSMDSLRRSSGTPPSGPQRFSSLKMPMSIISSCQGMGMLPEENSSKNVLSGSSRATPFTEENAPTSSRLLAYTTLGSGTKGGGRIPGEGEEGMRSNQYE